MLRARAASGVIWSTASTLYVNVASVVVLAVLARQLNPEAFGLVAMATVFVAFTQIFLDQGAGEAVVQREQLEPLHLDAAFWTNLVVGVVSTGVGFVAAEPIADFYGEPEVAEVIRGLSFVFLPAAIGGIPMALLRREFRFRGLAVASIFSTTLGGAGGIALALHGYGVMSLVGQTLIRQTVLTIVVICIVPWRPRMRFSWPHFLEVTSFGANIVGIRLMSFFNRRMDDLLIGYWLGPVALGYYAVGYRLVLAATGFVSGVLNNVALPAFSRIQNQPDRMLKAFYHATHLAAMIAIPGFVGLAVLAPWIIQGLFGPGWEPSVDLMRVLSLIGIIQSVHFLHGTVMVAMGRPSWKLKLHMVNAIANLTLFALVVKWGVLAVAVAYVARGYVLSPLSYFCTRKLIDLHFGTYMRQFVVPFLTTLAVVMAMLPTAVICADTLTPLAVVGLGMIMGLAAFILVLRFAFSDQYRDILSLMRIGTGRSLEVAP